MQRSNVVFPEPLGPMIDTRSPALTSRLIPFSTARLPKLFCRPTMRTRGFIGIANGREGTGRERPAPALSSQFLLRGEALRIGGRGFPIRRPVDPVVLLRRIEP